MLGSDLTHASGSAQTSLNVFKHEPSFFLGIFVSTLKPLGVVGFIRLWAVIRSMM
jgi:hypothetical protein